MRARVQKWGNSLAVRIPKSFAMEANLSNNTAVDVSVIDGKLIVAPAVDALPTLDALLVGITDENVHAEVSTGLAVGNEVW